MPADDALPDHVIMVSGADLQGCNLAGRLAERQQRAVCTGGVADVRATIACLVSKIQKLQVYFSCRSLSIGAFVYSLVGLFFLFLF